MNDNYMKETDSQTKELTLYDFSNEQIDIRFEPRNIEKPIGDLTGSDLLWCLRKRLFLEQIIAVVLMRIERDWDKINKSFTAEVGEWYMESVLQIVTLPDSFWETKHQKLEKIQSFIKNSENVSFKIEPELINRFLALKPPLFAWTNERSKEFKSNLAYDLLGNVLLAFRQISQMKYAVLNGQSVYIEQIHQSIRTEQELIAFIESESEDLGDYLEDLLDFLSKENTVEKYA